LKPKERKIRFNALSEYGCVICRRPAEVHHLIGYGYRGIGQKATDENTIPLCVEHHRGAQGIHHLGLKTWEKAYGEQSNHLKRVNEVLNNSTFF
jgi:hypothetical protein